MDIFTIITRQSWEIKPALAIVSARARHENWDLLTSLICLLSLALNFCAITRLETLATQAIGN